MPRHVTVLPTIAWVLALTSLILMLPHENLRANAETSAGDASNGSLCASTLSRSGGLPWRPSACKRPGYSNHTITVRPVVDRSETAVVRGIGRTLINVDKYAEPVYFARSSTPVRQVVCLRYGCVGGSAAPLTGDEHVAPGSDGQLVIVDQNRRRVYEMYRVETDPDGTVHVASDGSVRVGSLAVVDLDGRGNHTAQGDRLNITGAGVSRIFGVIRAPEIRAAARRPGRAIRHALQVSLPASLNCPSTWRAPATKTDGRGSSSRCVEQGARLQLRPGFACSSLDTKLGKAVCQALKRYGAYVMDNNGSDAVAFYAQQMNSWATARADLAAVGVRGDYQDLGIPPSSLRVLARWNGR